MPERWSGAEFAAHVQRQGLGGRDQRCLRDRRHWPSARHSRGARRPARNRADLARALEILSEALRSPPPSRADCLIAFSSEAGTGSR